MSDEKESSNDLARPNAMESDETKKDVMSSPEVSSQESLANLRDHRYECRSCSYVYDPEDGVKKFGIPAGTAFLSLDQANFKCPVCRAGPDYFRDIGSKSEPSGFEENFNYGFGVNTLTPGQKNVLIFGGLAFALACFLSLYSLN